MENDTRSRSPQTSDKFILRLPDGMRQQIATLAKTNSRSMNAEIVARLQESMTTSPSALASLEWADLVDLLQREAEKRNAKVSITIG